MRRYVAFTSLGTIDIGEFSSTAEAEEWARARFGAAFEAVDAQLETTVDVTTTAPLGAAAVILGALVVVLAWWLLGGDSEEVAA